MRTLILLLAGTTVAIAANPVPGLKVPPGFVVSQFAGPELANDIYTMHIDAQGRVYVAGRGYIRELIDRDGDGVADEARDLVPGLKDGPMGLLREGNDLYYVADGGLKKYDLAGGKTTLVLGIKSAGEHDAHAVRRGHDGNLYLLCGNTAGVSAKTITAKESPIREPVAGCFLRLGTNGIAVVAHGFRNAYDFDFNADDEAFTFDSDNERCMGLPWFEPTRFYHIQPGGHYGWLNPQRAQTWRRPPHFADVVPPVATLGRGSPTGVACYKAAQFPAKYRGGFFLADWTFGRVEFVSLSPQGRSYTAKPEAFLSVTGDNGFAPTGMAVHPTTGDLYVATGGRGTRGAVYRVRHTEPQEAESQVQHRDSPGLHTRATILAALGSADRAEQLAGLMVAKSHSVPERGEWLAQAEPRARVALAFAVPERAYEVGLHNLGTVPEAARLLQVALGDLGDPKNSVNLFEGYTPRRPIDVGVAREVSAAVRKLLPAAKGAEAQELLRLLAMIGDDHPEAVALTLATIRDAKTPQDATHGLIVLARLTAPRTAAQSEATAARFIALDAEMAAGNIGRERHWSLRMSELGGELFTRDPALPKRLVTHPAFGRADHVSFAKLPAFDRIAAARKFLATTDAQFDWQPDHLRLVDLLPEAERRAAFLKLWERGEWRDELTELLARTADVADRAKFVAGLRSFRAATVQAAALALGKLPPGDDREAAALLRALNSEDAATRTQVAQTLQQRFGANPGTDFASWSAWATVNRPNIVALVKAETTNTAAIRKRLETVNWLGGDAERGKKVYATANCAACHSGNLAIGPLLVGVGKRFGLDDLLTAVIDPNRDVSARYRTTRVTTTEGLSYTGIIVYEANDGILLQTSATDTVRVGGTKIESKTPLAQSLMPAGLLDNLAPGDVADLFAYLKRQ